MKLPVLFFALLLSTSIKAQSVLITDEPSASKIKKALEIIRAHEPIIYEAIVQHSYIQRYSNPEVSLQSTYFHDRINSSMWIFVGTGTISERSLYRIAGTIYHESLHILLELQRERNGDVVEFSQLSPQRKKQEEIFIYKKTGELLRKIGTPSWEIQEYDQWLEGAKNKNYF
jgi:hypothetical protein